jgi:DNA-binding CsgD family transcriptional regulator
LLDQRELRWEERIDVLRMLGRALYLTGDRDRSEEALAEAVAIGVANEPHRAIEPMLDQSFAGWLFDGLGRALPLAARARELAAGADPQLRERAEAIWGHLALATGDPDGLAATEPLARHLDDPGAGALAPAELTWPWARVYKFGMNATYCGRHDDAERAFRLAREVVERAGAVNALATLDIYIGNVLLRRGQLDEARRAAIRAAEFTDLAPNAVPYADLVHAEALLWLGRLDESEAVCAKAERSVSPHWFFLLWLAHLRGLRQLWQGDDAASSTFLEAERITRDAGLREPCHTAWAGHAVAAHLAVDRVDDAVRVVEWLEECAAPLPCRWSRCAAHLGRAQLAWHAGNDDTADDGFREALALHEDMEFPVDRVEALLLHGSFLRRRGRAVPARKPLKEAQTIAATHNAGWLEKRAREELALAGGRRRRSPEARDELTPAETRVAKAAAAGDSNSEIARRLHLSVNTVETHLKHIYAKLGIHSRRQLLARGEGGVQAKESPSER